ncbi:MAG: DUF305 domain-containing protein [Gemmatimonadota bacterium]|nr:DUF305 domain-containing protein [Gemmatimonadota bacterium]
MRAHTSDRARRPARLAFLCLITLAAGCGGSRPEPETGPDPTTDRGTDLEELEAIYEARADSARMNVSQADVDFMTGMIAHHAQALVMSRLAPTHGASPRIQTLAARIINAQKDEIALMQAWLRDRGQPVPEPEIEGITLTLEGVDEHHMHMPGMLTPRQMEELDAARGPEFDRLFLTYMIQHHEGAVTMVLDLFATDGAGQDETSFKLASDIQVDQRSEIARMERMLAALGDGGGS